MVPVGYKKQYNYIFEKTYRCQTHKCPMSYFCAEVHIRSRYFTSAIPQIPR